jgi:glyoxylase-like metal-dependent hydrolase (beta-lactamase superfamily II)
MELYRIEQLIVGSIGANCWIAAYGPADPLRRCAVIDPGEEADTIIAQLTGMSLRPAYILITHGHFDHIAALPDIHAAYPEALIAIHRADASFLGPDSLAIHRRSFAAAGGAGLVDALWKPMPNPGQELEDGDRIGPFTVLSTPGHTPGSVVFLLEEQKIMFSGDTLFRGDCGRVDLPGGNQREIEKSLKRLLALDGDIQVLPGHGESTSIAEERGTRFF